MFLALLAVCGPRHSDAAIRKLRIAESAAVGAPALLSAARSASVDRCKGVMFTDVEHGHVEARGWDLGTANGTWGFDLGTSSARTEL